MTFEQFQKDTEQHVLTILKDDGLYRHLLVKHPGTVIQHYSITTWPGYLCFSGDMGCFAFTRTKDMFEFFRCTPGKINEPYWHEKLEAVDRHGGSVEWDQEAFEASVNNYLQNWIEDNEDAAPEFIAEQKEKVKSLIEESRDSQSEALAARLIFTFEADEGGIEFVDFWEGGFQKYTGRFSWCCHAIVHAVALYDAVKIKEGAV